MASTIRRPRCTAVQQTHGQDGEAVAEAGGVQRQGQPVFLGRPQRQDPGDQRGKTRADGEGLAVRPFLGLGLAIPFAQLLVDRSISALQHQG
jgi:hypothetical protein